MHLTAAEITAWIGSFLWPLFRIAALFMVAPVFGSHSVPVRVRLSMALVITLIVVPLLPQGPAQDPFSLNSLLLIAQQILIGAAMGLGLQLAFSAVITGAQIIATKMGLGFASMVDPQNGGQVPVLSQFYLLAATLVFLAMNGHLILISVLVESFQTLPVAPGGIVREGWWRLAAWGGQMLAGAVWLALPAVASLVVVNIAFGVMARAAPQLNIFAVGFPVTLIMGFLAVFYLLPSAIPQIVQLMDDGFVLIRGVVAGGA